METLTTGVSVLVGAVLSIAGALKLMSPGSLAMPLGRLIPPLGRRLPLSLPWLAALLGVTEVSLGVLLVTTAGETAVLVSTSVFVMFACFTVFVTWATRNRIPCGCFGSTEAVAHAQDIFRTAILAVLALFLILGNAFWPRGSLHISTLSLASTLGGGLLLISPYMVGRYRENKRTGGAIESVSGGRRTFLKTGVSALGMLGIFGAGTPAAAALPLFSSQRNENGKASKPTRQASIIKRPLSLSKLDAMASAARTDPSLKALQSTLKGLGYVLGWASLTGSHVQMKRTGKPTIWKGDVLYIPFADSDGKVGWTPGGTFNGTTGEPAGAAFVYSESRIFMAADGRVQVDHVTQTLEPHASDIHLFLSKSDPKKQTLFSKLPAGYRTMSHDCANCHNNCAACQANCDACVAAAGDKCRGYFVDAGIACAACLGNPFCCFGAFDVAAAACAFERLQCEWCCCNPCGDACNCADECAKHLPSLPSLPS